MIRLNYYPRALLRSNKLPLLPAPARFDLCIPRRARSTQDKWCNYLCFYWKHIVRTYCALLAFSIFPCVPISIQWTNFASESTGERYILWWMVKRLKSVNIYMLKFHLFIYFYAYKKYSYEFPKWFWWTSQALCLKPQEKDIDGETTILQKLRSFKALRFQKWFHWSPRKIFF